ncbi:hypothetical protein PG993_006281 [Apiospora rasikravindrae]|uniref:Uncharacterized protein n=1 Tax=Apiospora rasikravindrae TaxID=990691 RepID=A0ABR1T591_9PEZI
MALHGTPSDLLQNLDPIALIVFIPLAGSGRHYVYNSSAKSIHVWIQAPAYVLVALSEAFVIVTVIVTGLELAYTQAPTNVRSVLSSLSWLTIGVAAAISISLNPVLQDLHLVWP